MKRIRKRLLFPVLLLVCTLLLSACSTAADNQENPELSMDSSMIEYADSLTATIIELDQSDIDAYLESGDDFTVNAMEAWEDNKDDLGEFVQIQSEDVAEISDGYTVTQELSFDGRDAEFIYTFDETGVPTALEISPVYTLGEQMRQAGMNTIMGICIVFVLLVVLSLLISLFRFIPSSEKKKDQQQESDQAEPAKAPEIIPAVQENAAGQEIDNQELVAVIAAAIAASEGTSTDGFVVRSIKKSKRKKW